MTKCTPFIRVHVPAAEHILFIGQFVTDILAPQQSNQNHLNEIQMLYTESSHISTPQGKFCFQVVPLPPQSSLVETMQTALYTISCNASRHLN